MRLPAGSGCGWGWQLGGGLGAPVRAGRRAECPDHPLAAVPAVVQPRRMNEGVLTDDQGEFNEPRGWRRRARALVVVLVLVAVIGGAGVAYADLREANQVQRRELDVQAEDLETLREELTAEVVALAEVNAEMYPHLATLSLDLAALRRETLGYDSNFGTDLRTRLDDLEGEVSILVSGLRQLNFDQSSVRSCLNNLSVSESYYGGISIDC